MQLAFLDGTIRQIGGVHFQVGPIPVRLGSGSAEEHDFHAAVGRWPNTDGPRLVRGFGRRDAFVAGGSRPAAAGRAVRSARSARTSTTPRWTTSTPSTL